MIQESDERFPNELVSRNPRRFAIEFNYNNDTISVKPQVDEDPRLMLHFDTLVDFHSSLFAKNEFFIAPDLIRPISEWRITDDSFEHIFGAFATRVEFFKHYLAVISMVFPAEDDKKFVQIEAKRLEHFSTKLHYFENIQATRSFTMNRTIQQLIIPEYMIPCNVFIKTTNRSKKLPMNVRVTQARQYVTRQYDFTLYNPPMWVDLSSFD